MTTKTRKLIVLKVDGGREEIVLGPKEDFLQKLYDLIGCRCVTRTEIKWEGKKRYVWLDDEGMLKADRKINPQIRPLSEAYWKRPCQNFYGVGVVELPNG